MSEKELALWAFAKQIEESAKAGSLEDCWRYAKMIQDVLTDCVISNGKSVPTEVVAK